MVLIPSIKSLSLNKTYNSPLQHIFPLRLVFGLSKVILTPSLQKALIALAPKCENLHTSFIFVITTDRNANFLYTMYTIHSKKTMPELKKWSKFPLDGAF